MTIKRLAILLAGVLILMLTACSGAEENDADAVQSGEQTEQDERPSTPTPTHTPTPSPTPVYYPWEKGEPEAVSWDESEYFADREIHGLAASVGISRKKLSDSTSKGVLLSTATWETVGLLPGYDTMYPLLDKALKANNVATEEGIAADYKQTLNYARTDERSESTFFMGPYYTDQDNVIIRADSRVFSILERYTTFYGGLHPSTRFIGITYDTETGALLTLEDILNPFLAADMEPLADYIEEVLVRDFADLNFTAGTGFILSHLNSEGFSWVLSNEGLEFIFNEFELLGSYAMSDQRVVIPFAGHEEWFDPRYRETAANWTTMPDQEGRVLCDIDGDGRTEYVTIASIWDEYYSITALDVYVSDEYYYEGEDERTRIEIYEWDPKPVFVHLEDGQSFIYVDVTGDNDQHLTYVYRITKNGASRVGDADGRLANAQDNGSYRYERTVFDPTHVMFVTRYDLLGTTYENNMYHIGEDGLPVRECDFYQIRGDYRVTVTKPLRCFLIDEEGTVKGEEVVIEPGEDVTFVRSNLRTKYDFTTATGSWLRMYIEMYNGEDIEEYFEGLNNAG